MTDEQKIAIWNWLEKKKYQTDYEATGEYKMYYDLDMPKIITDYLSEHSALKEQEVVAYICEKDDMMPQIFDKGLPLSILRLKSEGYTVTELVKK